MLTLASVVVLVVGSTAALAKGEQDEVWIWPLSQFDGTTYTVCPGQVGVIRHGWAAASAGLVRAFWRGLNQEYILTREDGWSRTIYSEEARQHLTPIERAPEWDEVCFTHRAMVSRLLYYLEDLEPGNYTLRSQVWLDHRLTDGCDSLDQDGLPDIVEGELFNTTVYIIVEDPDG
jgi:hypothetical protein